MSQTASHRHIVRRRAGAPARRGETAAAERADDGARGRAAAAYVWAAARLSLGWVFLWAFLDKTFGLGRATPAEGAWIDGGNPTQGYLSGATGPFDGLYHSLAGDALVNVLFMAGLAGVGAALVLGVAIRPAAVAGALMMLLMWTAYLPPETNPFMDEHVVYALVLLGLGLSRAGDVLGLGARWRRTALVRRLPWLA